MRCHCSAPPFVLSMAFKHATSASIHNSAFYDIRGHLNQFNIGQIVQISNTGTTHSPSCLINFFLLTPLQDGVLVQKPSPLKNCHNPTNLFTGRNDVLLQLHKCFTPSPTSVESAQQRRFVLYGLGGGGKTQIAFKFVKECQMETQPHRCA